MITYSMRVYALSIFKCFKNEAQSILVQSILAELYFNELAAVERQMIV